MNEADEQTTRAALERLKAALAATRAARIAEPEATRHAVEALGAAQNTAAPPARSRLDEARRGLIAAAAGGDVRAADPRHLREATWLLWDAPEPLVTLSGLFDHVVAMARRRPAVARRLIESWGKNFSADAARIDDGGRALRACIANRADDARFDRWRHADHDYGIFDAGAGPRRIAREIVFGAKEVEDVLRETGLDDPQRGAGGYARAVQREVLEHFAFVATTKGKPPEAVVSCCAAFLAPGGKLRFDEVRSRGEIARGLLAPWLSGERPPSDAAKEAVRVLLLRTVGDPRLHEDKWAQAGDDAVRLMLEWVTGATIELFFDLISDYALDKQFRYRKAFWSACFKKRGIAEAWLALGTQIRTAARAHASLGGAYAGLEGAYGNQAVLMMRIDRYVLCEWSHNGKLRAWQSDWKNAPRLRAQRYHKDQFSGKGLPFPPNPRFGSKGASDGLGLAHFSSEKDYWQGSAAAFLAERCNLHLSHYEWRP
jgi:hypothetical protein